MAENNDTAGGVSNPIVFFDLTLGGKRHHDILGLEYPPSIFMIDEDLGAARSNTYELSATKPLSARIV